MHVMQDMFDKAWVLQRIDTNMYYCILLSMSRTQVDYILYWFLPHVRAKKVGAIFHVDSQEAMLTYHWRLSIEILINSFSRRFFTTSAAPPARYWEGGQQSSLNGNTHILLWPALHFTELPSTELHLTEIPCTALTYAVLHCIPNLVSWDDLGAL